MKVDVLVAGEWIRAKGAPQPSGWCHWQRGNDSGLVPSGKWRSAKHQAEAKQPKK